MSKKLPAIAVIGSGYWGKNLVRNYYNIGVLKLICDRDKNTLSEFKAQYPDVDIDPEPAAALDDDSIQGVVIATPAETHYGIARKALLAGKHVYIEKPLVLHNREGRELIQLAEERNLVLMVGHLLQYHPIFVRLQDLVLNGDLGRINYIYSNRLNLGKIRREENILWSFAPHDISMILSLAGETPESVVATGGNYLHEKIADVTTTYLEFPSGLKAHIFVSWLHPFKEQKLVVVGDKKMAVFNDVKPWNEKLFLYPHKIEWQNNMPIPAKAEPEKMDIPQDEPLHQECLEFLRCIADGKRPITDGNEGLRVLNILNASQRSLNESGRKIYLQEQAAGESRAEKAHKEAGDAFFAHESAIIDANCEIGANTKIWHFSHILTGSTIGKDCNIGQNVVIGPDVTIGNGCKIQNNVSIYKGVTLEKEVFCGPSMVFTNVFNPRAFIKRMHEARPTLVKRGVTLGANCTIVCGNTIGKYAFIGAGATVIKDVPDFAMVAGNPGKVKGWVCKCGAAIYFDDGAARCKACDLKYKKEGDQVNLI
jgi:predicted dehydrogenase/acetyltransferase-like isoleucine patch superfamily enzyme